MIFATKQIFYELKDISKVAMLPKSEDFNFLFREDPSGLHRIFSGSRSISFQYPADNVNRDYTLGVELMIETETEENADLISNLVRIGCLLGYPDISQFPTPGYVAEADLDLSTWEEKGIKNYFERSYAKEPFRFNLLLGCSISAKAFGNADITYMLMKYKLSLELSSLTPHSVHPRYGDLFNGYENDYEFHVSGAHSFLAAYSIIEDLKVEIRSSQKNQRFIFDEVPKFNPEVENDIMKRLKEINVDGHEIITLAIRGENISLHESVKPELGSNSEYIHYEDVYDKDVTIVEAIHYSSYIRNFYLAHGFTEKNKNLSPYDIHNVQILVRRLLLTYFGEWTGSRRTRE